MPAEETTDHEKIKNWAEARKGIPVRVRGSPNDGVLRISFKNKGNSLEKITWEDFFKIFDRKKLVFLHQDKTKDGSESRFFKLIKR